jgi:hypothetical protein
MSADPTIPDPTAPISFGQLPAGLPEVCGPDGNTWLTVTPCTAENPTIEQACADPAYAPHFDACTIAPSSTYALPTTGTAAAGGAAIGGTWKEGGKPEMNLMYGKIRAMVAKGANRVSLPTSPAW